MLRSGRVVCKKSYLSLKTKVHFVSFSSMFCVSLVKLEVKASAFAAFLFSRFVQISVLSPAASPGRSLFFDNSQAIQRACKQRLTFLAVFWRRGGGSQVKMSGVSFFFLARDKKEPESSPTGRKSRYDLVWQEPQKKDLFEWGAN